jgi:hypothetical protein
MKIARLPKILMILVMLSVATLLIIGCNGDGSDTNPFVWPVLEYKVERTIQGGLDIPVGIVYHRYGGADGNTAYWYISNQGTTAGTGFISRVPFGQTTPSEVQWVANLTAPTGIAVSENRQLLVADVTDVVVIDTRTGTEVNRITITGAQNLQHIVVRNEEARFYVSDPNTRRIYRGLITGTTSETYRYDDSFQGLNALLLSDTDDHDYLYAGACNQIFSINVAEDGPVEEFITPPDNFCVDGLAKIYGGMFIISNQANRELYAVDTASKSGFLSQLNTGLNPGYIYTYIESDDTYYLYVPTMGGNEVRAYRVTADN